MRINVRCWRRRGALCARRRRGPCGRTRRWSASSRSPRPRPTTRATSPARRPPPRRSAGKCRSSTPPATRIRPTPRSRTSPSAAPPRIVDMVFPYTSIGAGLAAAKAAKIPVVTWGGGLGGSVAATNGSGGPMTVPVDDLMIKTMDGKGALLELTYHTGEVCRNREVELDNALKSHPDIKVDQERGAHSRLFRGRRAIRQRLARLASRRARKISRSGVAGTIRRSAPSARCAARTAPT